MKVWLTLYHGERSIGSSGRDDVLTKEVPWPVPPPFEPGGYSIIHVGTDDGESGSVNAVVTSVDFISDGTIHVSAYIVNLDATDEYDSVRASLLRDGFVAR